MCCEMFWIVTSNRATDDPEHDIAILAILFILCITDGFPVVLKVGTSTVYGASPHVGAIALDSVAS